MKFLRTDVEITDENRDSLKISDLKEFELKFFCPSKAGYLLRFTKAWDVANVAGRKDDLDVLYVTTRLAQKIIDLIVEELDYDDMTTEELHLYEKEQDCFFSSLFLLGSGIKILNTQLLEKVGYLSIYLCI